MKLICCYSTCYITVTLPSTEITLVLVLTTLIFSETESVIFGHDLYGARGYNYDLLHLITDEEKSLAQTTITSKNRMIIQPIIQHVLSCETQYK